MNKDDYQKYLQSSHWRKAVDRAIKNRAGTILAGLIRSGELDDRIAAVIESNWIKKG